MTRSALIVGAALAGLLLQSGPHLAQAQAKLDSAQTPFGQRSETQALYTRDQALRPSVAKTEGNEMTTPGLGPRTAPVLA